LKTRPLGRTGLRVSEIGFGCGTTAGLMTRDAPELQREAVGRALELGINYFDTAPVYGDTASEANLGRALTDLRARPVVATKVALDWEELDDVYGAVMRSVEASHRRLRIPCIDLVQLHNRVGPRRAPKPDIGSGALLTVADVLGPRGVLEAFQALRGEGRVSFFGCCAFGGDPASVAELIDSDAFDTVLVHYSAVNRTAWDEASDPGVRSYARAGARAARAGMGTIAIRVLERGKIADPGEAIRFVLSNAEVSTALVGFSDVAQVEQAARCAA
jgi:aryl-alcohol dehydrogenase-like predicted oxidoreductase